MPYVAANPKRFAGRSIGDGECVAFAHVASLAPHSSTWRRGPAVKASEDLAPGTLIATFDINGKYGSRKDGTSHAAIFLRRSTIGIVVLDQWLTNDIRQGVHERTIRFNNAAGKKINNGDEYYVVD